MAVRRRGIVTFVSCRMPKNALAAEDLSRS
jgi:hypothetical protein